MGHVESKLDQIQCPPVRKSTLCFLMLSLYVPKAYVGYIESNLSSLRSENNYNCVIGS